MLASNLWTKRVEPRQRLCSDGPSKTVSDKGGDRVRAEGKSVSGFVVSARAA
jgi:hypothetical protein